MATTSGSHNWYAPEHKQIKYCTMWQIQTSTRLVKIRLTRVVLVNFYGKLFCFWWRI